MSPRRKKERNPGKILVEPSEGQNMDIRAMYGRKGVKVSLAEKRENLSFLSFLPSFQEPPCKLKKMASDIAVA